MQNEHLKASTERTRRLKTKAAPITIELGYERSTKGTHVFAASDPAAPVPTLYVRKDALGAEPPRTIALTIAPAE